MQKRAQILTCLRQSIARIDGTRERLDNAHTGECLPLGVEEIDNLLDGGLNLSDLHEVRCSNARDIGCAKGFLLALLGRLEHAGQVIWITEPAAVLETGALFPEGLKPFGFDASRFIHIRPTHLNDALWAAGEAAVTPGLAAVVFHIKGNPKAIDFPASRKLTLRSQTSRTPIFVIRQSGEEEVSSAVTRWHVAPAASLAQPNFTKGVGNMRLSLTLERNRNGHTGKWTIAWNPETRSFENAANTLTAAHTGVPLHASAHKPHRPQAMGQVLAYKKTG